ncbi:MAG: hypothetical protein JJE08_07210 [Proteiniphilum sp.]|nr:hypothetical protein [Proteiniphilum sp.]
MKKRAVLFVVLLMSLSVFSQKTHRVMGWKISRDIPQNEIKLNLGTSIFGSFPEISYERILNTDISVGASAGIALEPDNYPVQFALMPYFRWFFGGSAENLQKYGAGFFIETNGGLFSLDTEELDYTNGAYVSRTENSLGAGLGLALGWKYLTRNNWVGEFYFGAGRDFVNDGAYPRMGITIGKRF